MEHANHYQNGVYSFTKNDDSYCEVDQRQSVNIMFYKKFKYTHKDKEVLHIEKSTIL